MHYYYVCTVPPGFVEDTPLEPGSNFLWAKKVDSGMPRPLNGGVRWSTTEIRITKAAVTTCRKCGQSKPEVSRNSSA